MSKINFNVPFLDVTGEPVQQIKIEQNKAKIINGAPQNIFAVDENGMAVYETMMVKDLVSKLLRTHFENDQNKPFGDRVKCGKLARKIMTSSTANYRQEELSMIQESAQKGGSIDLMTQLDELINGLDDTDVIPEEAA